MNSFLMAISGPTASGKSFFTNKLRERIVELGLTTVTISTDEFYRDLSHISMKERGFVNYDLPHSIDNEEFFKTLSNLTEGKSVKIQVYDYTTHTRMDKFRTINPADLIIIEGIFSLSFPEINKLYDIKIFIDLDQDLRLIRRVKRDMIERGRTLESILHQYMTQVRPTQKDYVSNDQSIADLSLNGNQSYDNFISLLISAIKDKNQNS